MNADQSQPIPESAVRDECCADPADSLPSATIAGGVARRLPLWLLTLGVGLVSGLISWAGGEAMLTMFRIEDEAIYPADYRKIGGYQRSAVGAEVQGAVAA